MTLSGSCTPTNCQVQTCHSPIASIASLKALWCCLKHCYVAELSDNLAATPDLDVALTESAFVTQSYDSKPMGLLPYTRGASASA